MSSEVLWATIANQYAPLFIQKAGVWKKSEDKSRKARIVDKKKRFPCDNQLLTYINVPV
ncbi:hypothetical protein [Noviherbaspirillum pedocola]|uniref:Uncharacterized protein n=1 Tax=Noviherbaspirillum pedocola TaxID=2801341 RepID=A0A934SZZ7_9BURK|nr:hypothetical protein [Noviherbaspirillum pedocola]MBK4735884.1 hypothetical protein [Noviherbaspirillum pedocola]